MCSNISEFTESVIAVTQMERLMYRLASADPRALVSSDGMLATMMCFKRQSVAMGLYSTVEKVDAFMTKFNDPAPAIIAASGLSELLRSTVEELKA